MNRTLAVCLSLLAALLAAPLSASSGKTSKITQKLPPQYVLEKLKGTVLILSKGKKTPEPAKEDQTVQAGDTVITRGYSEVSLTLNSDTMFHLSEDSEVVVSELSRKSSTRFVSRLKLAAGKILAQVQKLKQSRSVFEVESGGVLCGVRGTVFEVEKDRSAVSTSTFEGVVEMKKGKLSEKVPADRHAAYAGDKGVFTDQRVLSEREKARYENWKQMSDLVVQRQAERETALRAFDVLPQAKQDAMLKKLEEFDSKDRLRALRQMLREKEVMERDNAEGKASDEKGSALKEREEAERKAEEDRKSRLK